MGEVFSWGFFPVDLFTGLVVPTTCSLITCLITCMAIRNSEESGEESIRNSEESGEESIRNSVENFPGSPAPVEKHRHRKAQD